MDPDPRLSRHLRRLVESGGDRIADLHLWRLGPGHLGAIVSIDTRQARGPEHYRALMQGVGGLSHLTIEVMGRPDAAAD